MHLVPWLAKAAFRGWPCSEVRANWGSDGRAAGAGSSPVRAVQPAAGCSVVPSCRTRTQSSLAPFFPARSRHGQLESQGRGSAEAPRRGWGRGAALPWGGIRRAGRRRLRHPHPSAATATGPALLTAPVGTAPWPPCPQREGAWQQPLRAPQRCASPVPCAIVPPAVRGGAVRVGVCVRGGVPAAAALCAARPSRSGCVRHCACQCQRGAAAAAHTAAGSGCAGRAAGAVPHVGGYPAGLQLSLFRERCAAGGFGKVPLCGCPGIQRLGWLHPRSGFSLLAFSQGVLRGKAGGSRSCQEDDFVSHAASPERPRFVQAPLSHLPPHRRHV